jgi:hypothetical protein
MKLPPIAHHFIPSQSSPLASKQGKTVFSPSAKCLTSPFTKARGNGWVERTEKAKGKGRKEKNR